MISSSLSSQSNQQSPSHFPPDIVRVINTLAAIERRLQKERRQTPQEKYFNPQQKVDLPKK
jgi:hypothetical protein